MLRAGEEKTASKAKDMTTHSLTKIERKVFFQDQHFHSARS